MYYVAVSILSFTAHCKCVTATCSGSANGRTIIVCVRGRIRHGYIVTGVPEIRSN